MPAVSFFALIFSSLLWFIFALKFVLSSLGNTPFFAAGTSNILAYICIVCLPVFLIWLVFSYVNQYLQNKTVNQQLYKLFGQMKKNQDYSDLLARVLIETEQQVKDGFMLGKFDLLVADMNELLAEIIRCTNIASSEQIERLWNKVQNGGKWSFGKVIIEVNNAQPNFQMRIYEKACTDIVLAGTIMEFCARYLSVVNMLEKHDREKVFLNIIETGVMGKVFSIFAPISDEVRKVRESSAGFMKQQEQVFQAPKPQPAPHVSTTPVNVFSDEQPKESIFDKLDKINPFKKKEPEPLRENRAQKRDPFSIALERSFGSVPEDETPRLRMSEETVSRESMPEPRLSPPEEAFEPKFETEPAEAPRFEESETVFQEQPSEEELSDTQKKLNSLKKEWAEMTMPQAAIPEKTIAVQAEEKNENEDEENTAYPFGGWVDEENYNK